MRIDILFTRLGAIYGQLWWNNYRTENLLLLAKKEWSEGLKKFDNQVLKEVLVICREQKNYPPILPQFVESCRATQARRIMPLAKESANPSNLEVAKLHIAAMKTLLNK
ncbi:MAG: Vir protein [Legionella sp.]|nr:Vir protein [Legionella sp.]